MTIEEFQSSETVPAVTSSLRALWHDARGDWEGAHKCAQEDESATDCAWVHAYLHRKEGDISNARYWYARAGKPECRGPLEDEWREITLALLGNA